MAQMVGNFEDILRGTVLGAVKNQIDTMIKEEFDHALDNAIEEINRKKEQMIASMALRICSQISYERCGQTIKLELRVEDLKK